MSLDQRAAEDLGRKLEELYRDLPDNQKEVFDFVLAQAVRGVTEQVEANSEVGGYGQDAMKRVLFGAAGVTGQQAVPGAINWIVKSARDANLFS